VGTINKALGRDTKDRLKQAVIRNGREAITHYRVIDRFKSHTHVKAILETGRTHQIRVHLSHIGHALIGDSVYGGKLRFPKKASEDLKSALFNFRRQALHSRKLSLHHPETGELMSWRISLPADMLNLLNVIDRFDKII
jgi:23S rRNA pseudouridine1911/1915/1917 synthase